LRPPAEPGVYHLLINLIADGDTIIFTKKPDNAHDYIPMYGGTNPKLILFAGNDGRVYGNVTLTQTLTIPAGSTLTIPVGTSLNNQGRIINNGTIVGRERLTGNAVEGESDNPGNNNPGNGDGDGEDSGGGCNAGIGFAGMVALAMGLIATRKRNFNK
jgi:hypothetical protein